MSRPARIRNGIQKARQGPDKVSFEGQGKDLDFILSVSEASGESNTKKGALH